MKIFDRARKRQQRNAAGKLANAAEYDYVREYAAEQILDRLNDIMREFPVALDLGCGPNAILRAWSGHGDIKKLFVMDTAASMITRDPELLDHDELTVVPVVADEEHLPFAPGSLDLVLSSLSLHWVNDLPDSMKQIRAALRPDGCFLGAMLGGETLGELRTAFLAAELERRGGVSQHVSPMVQMSDVGNLLSAGGFTLSTVDSDTVTVEYPSALHVLEHLQGMGENGALIDYTPASRDLLLATAAAYQAMHGNPDGSVPVTFQIIYMIGWAPHDTQQQPLERGSAEFSLRDLTTHTPPSASPKS